MDEERFNISVRKYLKNVGVTSQREIEKAVRDAIETGRIEAGTALPVKITLDLDAVGLRYVVDGVIDAG